MTRLVALRTVSFDTNTVGPGETTPFFQDRDGNAKAITEFNEGRAVEWMMRHDLASRLLVEVLELPGDSSFVLGATRPFTTPNEKPGDVDAVICDPRQPQHAIALECKRIKVTSQAGGEQRINRLDAFGESHLQANSLARIGFSRTFLTAIALADGRGDQDTSYPLRGPDASTFNKVFKVASAVRLDESVGLLYIEVSQPVQAPVSHSATVAMGILRHPKPQEQRGHFTAEVKNYIDAKGRQVGGWR